MERDKFLTEAMGGKQEYRCMIDDLNEPSCVLQEESDDYNHYCVNADTGMVPTDCEEWTLKFVGGVTDFSTWQGFGELIEFLDNELSDQEIADLLYRVAKDGCIQNLPSHMANAVYEFLKERNHDM